jgi:hypothetical protein
MLPQERICHSFRERDFFSFSYDDSLESNATGKDMPDGGGGSVRDNRYRVTGGFWGS